VHLREWPFSLRALRAKNFFFFHTIVYFHAAIIFSSFLSFSRFFFLFLSLSHLFSLRHSRHRRGKSRRGRGTTRREKRISSSEEEDEEDEENIDVYEDDVEEEESSDEEDEEEKSSDEEDEEENDEDDDDEGLLKEVFVHSQNAFFQNAYEGFDRTEIDPSDLTFRKCEGFDGENKLRFDGEHRLDSADKVNAVKSLRKFPLAEYCRVPGLAIIEKIVKYLFTLFTETPFLLFLGSLVGFCEDAHVTQFHTYARETDALAANSEQFKKGSGYSQWLHWLRGFSSKMFGVRFQKDTKLYLGHCLTRKVADGFALLWGDGVRTRQIDVAAYADKQGKSDKEDCVHPTHYEEVAKKVFSEYLNKEHQYITVFNVLFGHFLVKPFIQACIESGKEVYKLASVSRNEEVLHEAHEREGIYVVAREIEGKAGKRERVFYWFAAVCQPAAISKQGVNEATSLFTRALDIANVVLRLLKWGSWPKQVNPFYSSLGPVGSWSEPFLHPKPHTFSVNLVNAPSNEALAAEENRVQQEQPEVVIPSSESDGKKSDFFNEDESDGE
jgi:hypothetical protein